MASDLPVRSSAPTAGHGHGHHGRHERGAVPGPAAGTTAPAGRAWLTTLVACLGVVVAYLPFTGTTTALPTMAAQLHASTSDLQWVSDLFVIAMAAVLLPAGVIGDVHGRKKVFAAGLVLTFVGSVIGMAARNVHTLWIGEAVMGCGAAALLPSSLALISHAVPDPLARARHIAAWASSLGAGLAVGGVSAGVILDHAQWRWIFAPAAGLAVVILLIAALALADSRAPAGRTLDWFGQLLAAIAVTALVYGVIEGGSTSWSSAHAVAGFAVAAVAVLGFIPVELNVRSPMLDLALFRSRGFTGAVVVATIGMFALTGSLFVLSLYFGTVQHLSGLDIAWRIAVACVVMMVAGPIAGIAMKVLSPVLLMVAGLLFTAGALLWSVSLDPGTGFGPTAGRVALLGFGLGILFTPMTAAAVSSVSLHQAGMAGAGLNALRQTGGALGPAVLGALLTSRAVSPLPSALASHGVTGPARESVLQVVQQAGLGGAATYPYGPRSRAVQGAFSDSLTRAMHTCTLVGAGVLVFAALAALLIEHGPRLFARQPEQGPLALAETIAETVSDS
jgi:EmrB/QacA subfamily drug resistance transporter